MAENPSRNINLAERRQGREPLTVTAPDGTVFTFPLQVPATLIEDGLAFASANEDPQGAAAATRHLYMSLFDGQAEQALMAIGIDEIFGLIEDAWGVSLGLSPASDAPSRSGSRRSKQISKSTTKST